MSCLLLVFDSVLTSVLPLAFHLALSYFPPRNNTVLAFLPTPPPPRSGPYIPFYATLVLIVENMPKLVRSHICINQVSVLFISSYDNFLHAFEVRKC
jgi:hypothetical protein